MKDMKYIRKGKIITGPDGDADHKTINKAKKESRKIQMNEDGALGRGTLRTVK